MGFIKDALGMVGDAATGGLASGIGSFISGIFGDRGLSKKDQVEIMNKQHGYELENMDYQAKLNEEMAQRNQERQNEYFGMTAEKYKVGERQADTYLEKAREIIKSNIDTDSSNKKKRNIKSIL